MMTTFRRFFLAPNRFFSFAPPVVLVNRKRERWHEVGTKTLPRLLLAALWYVRKGCSPLSAGRIIGARRSLRSFLSAIRGQASEREIASGRPRDE
jgi:hypothetical protein